MNNIDWIPVGKTPKSGVVFAVCGRETGSNRPFWTRGFYLAEYANQATRQELAAEGKDNFTYSEFHDAWFWPEGWYETCDFDGSAYPMGGNPKFYAEVELPLCLMTAAPNSR